MIQRSLGGKTSRNIPTLSFKGFGRGFQQLPAQKIHPVLDIIVIQAGGTTHSYYLSYTVARPPLPLWVIINAWCRLSAEVLLVHVHMNSDCIHNNHQSEYLWQKVTAGLMLPGVVSMCGGQATSRVRSRGCAHREDKGGGWWIPVFVVGGTCNMVWVDSAGEAGSLLCLIHSTPTCLQYRDPQQTNPPAIQESTVHRPACNTGIHSTPTHLQYRDPQYTDPPAIQGSTAYWPTCNTGIQSTPTRLQYRDPKHTDPPAIQGSKAHRPTCNTGIHSTPTCLQYRDPKHTDPPAIQGSKAHRPTCNTGMTWCVPYPAHSTGCG